MQKLTKRSYLVISTFLLLPTSVLAQGLTLQGTTNTSTVVGSFNYITAALIFLRFALVSTLMIAGIVAIFQGYLWINHEGNMLKAYNAKESLAKAAIVVTLCFIALSVFHYFVPDYALLQI